MKNKRQSSRLSTPLLTMASAVAAASYMIAIPTLAAEKSFSLEEV